MDLENGMKVGHELLRGKGLNHSAFTREVTGRDNIDQGDRNKTKKLFDAIFEGLSQENGESMYKDGHDYFLKVEQSKEDDFDKKAALLRITELEAENASVKAENARLNGLVGNLKDKMDNVKEEKPVVLRTWKYNWKTGESKLFDMDKVSGLGSDWKEGPKPK